MIFIRNARSGQRLGMLFVDDVQFLAHFLEERTGGETSFYIDTALVDIMASNGAPASLVDILRNAVADTDGVDVLLSDPLPVLPRESTKPVPRRMPDHLPAEVSPEDSAAATDELAAETEEEAEPDADTEHVGRLRSDLRCAVCNGTTFTKRQIAVRISNDNDPSNSAEQLAECQICDECGHVHWFIDPIRDEPL